MTNENHQNTRPPSQKCQNGQTFYNRAYERPDADGSDHFQKHPTSRLPPMMLKLPGDNLLHHSENKILVVLLLRILVYDLQSLIAAILLQVYLKLSAIGVQKMIIDLLAEVVNTKFETTGTDDQIQSPASRICCSFCIGPHAGMHFSNRSPAPAQTTTKPQ